MRAHSECIQRVQGAETVLTSSRDAFRFILYVVVTLSFFSFSGGVKKKKKCPKDISLESFRKNPSVCLSLSFPLSLSLSLSLYNELDGATRGRDDAWV